MAGGDMSVDVIERWIERALIATSLLDVLDEPS
jgi:hypothetical protein